jgi:hypothetical protein
MTAIPARRRRRLIAAVTSSVLTAIALPGGLVLGANSLLNETGGNKVTSEATAVIPETPVQLLVITNARNEVASLALIAIAPGNKGGTIVSLPVGANADTPKGEAPRRIVDLYATGGLDAVRTDAENLLNITISTADDLTEAELAAILGPVGNQSVTLPQPVIDAGVGVAPVTVLKAGSITVSPAQIAAGLAATQAGVPEATRLPQVKALWTAVARAGLVEEATTTSTTAVEQVTAPTTTAEFMTALFSGRVDVWQFAGSLMNDAVRNPTALDMYALDGGEVLTVMASVAPSAMRITSTNISVMIDLPFNSISYAKEAVTRLAFMGANVVLLRQTTDAPQEQSVVYYNDAIARTEAENYVGLLGPLKYVESADVIEGVNLRIVLGNDFAAALGAGIGTTTTTVKK